MIFSLSRSSRLIKFPICLFVAQCFLHQFDLFFECPFIPLYFRVQVVVPSLPALSEAFEASPIGIGKDLKGHFSPLRVFSATRNNTMVTLCMKSATGLNLRSICWCFFEKCPKFYIE